MIDHPKKNVTKSTWQATSAEAALEFIAVAKHKDPTNIKSTRADVRMTTEEDQRRRFQTTSNCSFPAQALVRRPFHHAQPGQNENGQGTGEGQLVPRPVRGGGGRRELLPAGGTDGGWGEAPHNGRVLNALIESGAAASGVDRGSHDQDVAQQTEQTGRARGVARDPAFLGRRRRPGAPRPHRHRDSQLLNHGAGAL